MIFMFINIYVLVFLDIINCLGLFEMWLNGLEIIMVFLDGNLVNVFLGNMIFDSFCLGMYEMIV